MKIQLLLALLLISMLTFGQDDYCSCMETDNSFQNQNSYEDLFTSLSQYKEKLTFWHKQTTTITRTKIVIPPKETVTQTLVEEAFIQEKEELLTEELEQSQELVSFDKTDLSKETEDEINDKTFEQVAIKTERTEREKSISGKGRLASAKVKTKKKRLKGKLKRKKRVRLYRGGCPSF